MTSALSVVKVGTLSAQGASPASMQMLMGEPGGPAGLLSKQKVQLLDRLGVQWQPSLTESEARWGTCFAHLVAFARRHNHCQARPQEPLRHSSMRCSATGINGLDWF